MSVFRMFPLLSAGTFLAFVTALAVQNPGSSPSASDGASQVEKSKTPVPLIRATTSLAIVDVVVTHNGHPVKGLQQQSFRIFEDGREQAIKTFEEHGPGSDESKTEKPPALPPGAFSNFPESSTGSAINVLLLDAVNTPMSDQAYARKKIIDYLKTIPAGTRLAIFTMASRLRLVQEFTTDSAVLLAALKKTAPTQSPVLDANTGESASERIANPGIASPGVNRNTLDSVVESLRQFEADEEANLTDRRIQITLDALKELALYLGALPGRKNVIWFSASFPLSLTPESDLDPFRSQRLYAGALQQISDLLTASRVAVYPVDARGLITLTPPAARPSPRPAAVPIGGGRTGMIDTSAFPTAPTEVHDRLKEELATMMLLADQTGGIPFYNSNEIRQAIGKAVENGSSYYTLAYSPEDKKFDGRFRKIQIKLSGHDYHLAYRRGYFADSPTAHSKNALLNTAAPGLQPGAPPSSQILFRARILSAGDPAAQDLERQPGPAGDLAAKLRPPVKHYWIEYTADMHQVSAELDSNGKYRSNIEFIAIAYDHDGKVVNATRRAFKLAMQPAKYDELLQIGYSVRNEIDLPAGDVWLRLGVHDVSADRIGAFEVPLKTSATNPN